MSILRQIYQAVVLCIAIHLAYQQTVDDDGYFYYQRAEYPKDCQDVLTQCTDANTIKSGVYLIKPEGYEEPFEVYCDHDTDDGGWTVFQRRIDNTVDFARTWQWYKVGFGFLNQEFWMGNDKLAYLTNQKTYRLRINMTINNNQKVFAEYGKFRITDETGFYEIVHLSDFVAGGGTTDLMMNQLDTQFSTSDNTTSGSTCAQTPNAGGWWFAGSGTSECNRPNLNGQYGNSNSHPGIHWQDGVTVAFSEMKVKPVPTT